MRPRAVVFIGNGFTIGLSHELDIFDWHDTTSLLPPAGKLAWIQEASIAEDFPLWNERRYPELLDHWKKFEKRDDFSSPSSFGAFCESLANERAFESFHGGEAGRHTLSHSRSAPLQLRRYLWHALRALTNRFQTALSAAGDGSNPWPFPLLRATSRWPLAIALRQLAELWDLTIVSFNYEHYLEQMLQAHGCSCQCLRLSDFRSPEPLQVGSFRVIHPHGELATQVPAPGGCAIGFDDSVFGMQALTVFRHIDLGQCELDFSFPPKLPCPDLPDLVPPGHDDSHILGARSRNRAAIQWFVKHADVIGTIGFSAQRPDDQEFTDYLEARRPGVTTFWIGRQPENGRESSDQILGNLPGTAGHFAFDAAVAESEFLPWVKTKFAESLSRPVPDEQQDIRELVFSAVNAIMTEGRTFCRSPTFVPGQAAANLHSMTEGHDRGTGL
jgi:hypothetical protein